MQIEFGDHTYNIGRLTPWTAFHVLRRVAPILVGIGPQIVVGLSTADEETKLKALMGLLLSTEGLKFAHLLAAMPDSDMNYVATHALSNVTVMDVSGNLAPVLARGSDIPRPMFDFVTLPVMVRLINEVIRLEFLDFLAVSPSTGALLKKTATT